MERIADFLATYGRHEPFRCAYVGGTFDCLHRGHLALLANTRKVAARVVASVNRDEFAARYKRQPLMPLADRVAVLEACRLVDAVVVNSGDEQSGPAIEASGADCIVHGSDWVGPSLLAQLGVTTDWLAARGITVVTLPYTPWTSTTQLLAAFQARRQQGAA